MEERKTMVKEFPSPYGAMCVKRTSEKARHDWAQNAVCGNRSANQDLWLQKTEKNRSKRRKALINQHRDVLAFLLEIRFSRQNRIGLKQKILQSKTGAAITFSKSADLSVSFSGVVQPRIIEFDLRIPNPFFDSVAKSPLPLCGCGQRSANLVGLLPDRANLRLIHAVGRFFFSLRPVYGTSVPAVCGATLMSRGQRIYTGR